MEDRALAHFYLALRSDIGYVVATNDPKRLVQEYHRARRRIQNPLFKDLKFVIAPNNQEVWIVKESPYRGKGK